MANESLPAEQLDLSSVSDILEHHRAHAIGGRLNLISVLEAIQESYGYLPEPALDDLSAETGESVNRLYGLASFYKSFSFEPKGKHVVSVCLGTACHVRKSPEIVDEFSARLGIKPGETTEDREYTLETVNCVGACALGPVAIIDGTYYPKLRRPKVKGILKQIQKGIAVEDVTDDPRIFPVSLACPHCEASLMDADHPVDDHPSCRLIINHEGRERELRLSGLWGSPHFDLEGEVPEGSVTAFSCPHCRTPLEASILCPRCEAPLQAVRLVGGGAASICSRRGCPEHLLDLEGTTLDSLMMGRSSR